MTIPAAASETLWSRRLSLVKASTDSIVTPRHRIAIDAPGDSIQALRPRRSFQPTVDAARPLNINTIEPGSGTAVALQL